MRRKGIEAILKTRETNMLWYNYILDSISSEDVDVSKISDKEKIEFAFKMFYEEKVKNERRKISRLDLLTEWLLGLCSTVNIAFTDYDIEQIGKSWGYNDSNFVNDWFKNVATKMFNLAIALEVDIDKYL